MAWTLEDFEKVMRAELARWGGRHGIEEVPHNVIEEGATWRSWHIYTDLHRYRFTAIERVNGRSGLMGSATTRKPRAGEDWNRGSDLADGPLHPDTWHRILADIVSYEMVKWHDPKLTARRAEIRSGWASATGKPAVGSEDQDGSVSPAQPLRTVGTNQPEP